MYAMVYRNSKGADIDMSLKPLFPNSSVGNTVTVDLDVWMEYFLRDQNEIPPDEKSGITIGYIQEQIVKLECKLEMPIIAHYRRSSKGHIHLRLLFTDEITVFDAFLLRSCLFDDLTRHSLDERRYALWGSLHEMNKCFDHKGEPGGKVYSSGPWISLNIGRDNLTGEALIDFQNYMKWRRDHPLKNQKEEGQTALGLHGLGS